jgi:predicted dehydrogenase
VKYKDVINLLVIGIGPHSKRVYLPAIKKLSSKHKVKIVYGLELLEKKNHVSEFLEKNNYSFPVLYIKGFDKNRSLPTSLKNKLNKLVSDEKIDGVIIATEPMVHKQYALWALQQGLNILMDKPITVRKDVVSDLKQAKGIEKDFLLLENKYLELQKKKETIFSVNVQRRYHFGIIKVLDLIKEITEKYNVPVTSIQSTHADGQWYFPIEILERKYHSLNDGYGKCSHSGYHFFDLVTQIYKAGSVEGKNGDNAEIYSSFIQPDGWLSNISEKDYISYFGNEYKKYSKNINQKEFKQFFKNYGELDALSSIRINKEETAVCNISINLLHNSFSQRTWLEQGEDLYKGNGRVKQEHHIIQQGPFQSIHIHAYQEKDDHSVTTTDDYKIGGANHFEIHVFRNLGAFSNKKTDTINRQSFKIYDLKEINGSRYLDDSQLTHEFVKQHVVEEFIEFIEGKRNKNSLISNIDSHNLSVKIMSSIYQSHIKRAENKAPIINISLK